MAHSDIVDVYKSKAEATACKIIEVNSFEEAIPTILQIAKDKAFCELLDDEDVEKGPYSINGVPTRIRPILAAPDLDEELYIKFETECKKLGMQCLKSGLRKHLAGIDIGITQALAGIAESGTCIVDTNKEDTRLATMICEFSIIVLKKSFLLPTLISSADILRQHMAKSPTSYTTYISGPSRTADIERVGAIGVHGPLEMYIILLES